MRHGLEVTEYSPKKIKQSITGNGNADKQQVWKMLQHTLGLDDNDNHYFDASDALAVALCHHYQTISPLPSAKNKMKGWEDFVVKNPGRVR